MSSGVALYEALTSAPDERARARVIAEAIERLEARYPHLPDLATQAHLRETRRSRLQSLIARRLDGARSGGEAFVECSVATAAGVKVADVAWASVDFLRRHGDANPYPEAPEIVVEVLSESSSRAEMDEKKALYFEKGARECWLCTDAGELMFFEAAGRLERSRLAPAFPARVHLQFGGQR